MAEGFRVTAVVENAPTQEFCRRELDGLATVAFSALDALPDEPDFNLLLLDMSVPLREGISLFARCRARWPVVPVIILVPALEACLAIELIKCGAEDVSVEPHETILRRKAQRALLRRPGPVLDMPELEPLVVASAQRPNQRRCFRAAVPSDMQVRATLQLPGGRIADLRVIDVSVEAQGAPGGLGLSADRAQAASLPIDDWVRGEPILLALHVPDRGRPIAMLARLVGPTRRTLDQSVCLGVVYEQLDRLAKGRVEQLWIACQRERATSDQPSSSKPSSSKPSSSRPSWPRARR
jgi:CheY-like chemotaxis protein